MKYSAFGKFALRPSAQKWRFFVSVGPSFMGPVYFNFSSSAGSRGLLSTVRVKGNGGIKLAASFSPCQYRIDAALITKVCASGMRNRAMPLCPFGLLADGPKVSGLFRYS